LSTTTTTTTTATAAAAFRPGTAGRGLVFAFAGRLCSAALHGR
jgi:hypothetical protein